MALSLKAGFVPIAGGCAGLPAVRYPGAQYLISGLTQGTLGAHSVLAQAISATDWESDVVVFAAGEVSGDSYAGVFDWTTCELERVQDLAGNDVGGAANIGFFRWFDADTNDNVVSRDAVVGAWPASVGLFNGNRIEAGVTWTWAGSVGTIDVVRSRVAGLTTVSLAIEGSLELRDSEVLGQSVINAGAGSTGDLVITESYLQSTEIQYTSPGELRLDNTRMAGSNITRAAGDLIIQFAQCEIVGSILTIPVFSGPGIMTLDRVSFLAASTITGGATVSSTVSLIEVTLFGSVLNVVGTQSAVRQVSNVLANKGTLILGNNVTGFSVVSFVTLVNEGQLQILEGSDGVNIYVETGILDMAGFNATNVRLQDANSTLIANVTDAIKSGYVNALP